MNEAHRPRVVVPGDEPLQIAGSPRLDELEPFAEVVLHDNRPADDAQKLDRVAGAVAIINSRGQVTWPGELLGQLPDLKMITTCGIGTDAIDLDACRELGIVVSNIPGRTARVVAEHALALMVGVSRRLAYFTEQMKAGRWHQVLMMSLSGKTLGVIGTGNIGCAMIELARGIGMNVVAWTFHPDPEKAERLGFEYVEQDDLFRNSDVVSVHVKLTDDSRYLVAARQFELMRPGSLLVNTARGAVVDTRALVAALDSGHLGGAAIDVFETEPLTPGDPLLSCEQVILTPHCADQTPEGFDLLNQGCVENVIAFLEGRPQNVVT